MYCRNCGAEIEDNAVFCNVCGKKVVPVDTGQSAADDGPVRAESGTGFSDGGSWFQKPEGNPQGRDDYASDGERTIAYFPNPDRRTYSYDETDHSFQREESSRPSGSYAGEDRGRPSGAGREYSYQDPYGDANGGGTPNYARPSGMSGVPTPSYNPYDHTAEFNPKDISANKVICMVIYLIPVFGLIIALLADHGSNSSEEGTSPSYIGFNIRQDLKLEVFGILAAIIAGIVGVIILLISGAVGASASGYYGGMGALAGIGAGFILPLVINIIVFLIILVVRIICFVNICKGRAVEAPIVRGMGFMR